MEISLINSSKVQKRLVSFEEYFWLFFFYSLLHSSAQQLYFPDMNLIYQLTFDVYVIEEFVSMEYQ